MRLIKANIERAKRITKLFHVYAKSMSDYKDVIYLHEGRETMLSDLLADIRHWADKYDVDLYKALERSYNYYLEEKTK